jgi:hypothetical protein
MTELSDQLKPQQIQTMKKLKYLAALALAAASLVAFPTIANALTIGDNQELGFVQYGIPSGTTDRLTYVNHLIDMPLGTSDTADGQDYTRSTNFFGSLPDAVLAGAVDGTSTTINLGSGGSYSYLFAKYDGPNYGSEVWYVGNLSGVITIPSGAGEQNYGLSGWTLFGPGGGNNVPDGGSTLAMLGIAMTGLSLLKRKLSKS